MAASIFVFCSGVRSRLANETVHAIFASFPTCFVQLPCSPANIVPAAKSPAVTNAMSLVIVGTLDIPTRIFIQNALRDRTYADAVATALCAVSNVESE